MIPTMLPAVIALFVSMAFTIFAIDHPDIARVAALPLGLIVVGLLIVSALRSRGKTQR